MSPLMDHIQNQQDLCSELCDILDIIDTMNDGNPPTDPLIRVARRLARELNKNLDYVSLPEERSSIEAA